MAQFCIEIADEDTLRVMQAVGANYKYKSKIDNPSYNPDIPEDPDTNPSTIDNPEGLFQFVNRIAREWLMENTKAYELKVAKNSISQPSNPTITDPN